MSDEQSSTRAPLGQPRFVLAAMAVGLIGVFAVVLAWPRTTPDLATPNPELSAVAEVDTPTESPASPQSTAPDVTSSNGGGDTASVCGLPAEDQLIPAIPPDVEWELVGQLAVPTAPATHGPGVVDGRFRSCFGNTPTGALFAGANYLALTTAQTVEDGNRLVTDYVAEGRGKAALLVLYDANPADVAPPGGPPAAIAGYTFRNYSPTVTSVDLLLQTGGAFVRAGMSMRWENGDWKLIAPDNGLNVVDVEAVPDATGYVPWGSVN